MGGIDIGTILVVIAVLGVVGEGTTHLTDRMLALRRGIRRWAVGLGIATGIVSFFLIAGSGSTATNQVGAGVFGGAMAGAASIPAWYAAVAVLTFLFQYTFGTVYRFLFGSAHGEAPRINGGTFVLATLGTIVGFIVGCVVSGWVERNLGTRPGIVVFFSCIILGGMAPWLFRWSFHFLGWGGRQLKSAGHLTYEKGREAYQVRIAQAESDQQATAALKKEAALQAECDTARRHLIEFYNANAHLLATAFPPALMEAFLYCEMHDSLPPAQLWAVCQRKIAELQPMILQERENKKVDDHRAKKRDIRLKQIDADIRACREKILRLTKSGLDPEFIEDETHGLVMRIRQLEEQKELLSTLGEMVDA